MVGDTTEVGQYLFIVDIHFLIINIKLYDTCSEITLFSVPPSLISLVPYRVEPNMTIDLVSQLFSFRKYSRVL
jgi:hypothetical protein